MPLPSAAPLRVSALLALRSWDFFDILHLHTVELASADDLAELTTRLRAVGKGFVFTAHDLTPNIESDADTFDAKTRFTARNAPRVVTLTHAASEQISARFGVQPSVIPHGFAVPPGPALRRGVSTGGLLAFGALRPNRDFVALVRAWRTLPVPRVPLRILIRSVGLPDRQRYADELAFLTGTAGSEPDLTVRTVDGLLPQDQLLAACREAGALVMPYRNITHSGQLELARDLALPVVLPDSPTLRDQLGRSTMQEQPCLWFPVATLGDPVRFGGYLAKASGTPKVYLENSNEFYRYRVHEHEKLLSAYAGEYRLSYERG